MPSPAYQRLKDINALPSPTGVVLEVLRLVGDENTTLNAIAAVVESDPALAGRILKLVNSSFAGTSRRIASIAAAVKLLGLRTTKNLALGLSLVSTHRDGRCKSFDYEGFWSESLGRAVAARQIAAQLNSFPPDEAFATGLLCKVGRLALAAGYPGEYARVLDAAGNSGSTEALDMERQAFGINHNELSSELMADWRIEEFYCAAVRCQNLPVTGGPATDPRAGLFARILSFANAFTVALCHAQTQSETLLELTEKANQLGIPREACDRLFDSITAEWREAGAIFSVTVREMPALEELLARTEAAAAAAGDILPRSDTEQAAAKAGSEPLQILIVDDDPVALRMLEKSLTGAGYRVTTASNGAEALEIDRSEAPPMIITDWVMPVMDGLELCRKLRADEGSVFAYIILLTAHSQKAQVIEALNAGVDDFVAKPFNREELLAHVRAGERIVRLQADLAKRNREIATHNTKLTAANDLLKSMATTDELTRLANRREALMCLAEHWSLADRYHDSLSCIIADIDHFKQLNDAHGHSAGDAALRVTAELLRKNARAGDVVCRIGGEEFLIICPRSTAASASVVAERMRVAVAAGLLAPDGEKWSVTISMGVAERAESMEHPDDLLKAADEMLYAAKQAGRDRVCAAGGGDGPATRDPEHGERTERLRLPLIGNLDGLPVRVMVVDDDTQARALYRRILEREGYVVAEASDGIEAIEMVPNWGPDVIVLDAMMPRLDGLGCARWLKARAATQDIPLIMLSAADDAKDIEAALEAGVDEYITKPPRHREFALRVRSMSRLHRGKAELLWSNQRRWEQTRALQVLLDLSVGLLSIDSIAGILERTTTAVAELMRCRRVSIMLPDAERAHLTIRASTGIDGDVAASVRVPVGDPIAGQVFLSGEQVVINGTEETQPQRGRYDSQCFVSAPLMCKALRASERVVGVLNITERHGQRPFEESELEFLDLLSGFVAAAIADRMSRQERDKAQDSIVAGLATLAEYHDADTGSHLDRVTRYALILADGLRSMPQYREWIDPGYLDLLRRAMPLHDIGKVAVPDQILRKPGRLTDGEMLQIRRHSEIGARTIQSIRRRLPDASFLQMAEEIAHGHHERWDGTGYPQGIGGEAIPLSARIAALADVYDALRARRAYKGAMPHDKAVTIIRQGAGSQFDPTVVEVFLARAGEFARIASALAVSVVASEPLELVT